MAVPHVQIQGRKSGAVFHEEAMRKLASDRTLTYEAHEFLVPGATMTPEDINTLIDHTTDCTCGRAAGFGGVIVHAERVSIRNRGVASVQAIFNETDSDPITIEDGEMFDWDFTEVSTLRLGNTGGTAVAVRVLAA